MREPTVEPIRRIRLPRNAPACFFNARTPGCDAEGFADRAPTG
jgi:hypothetical protein